MSHHILARRGSPRLREHLMEHDFESFGPSVPGIEGQIFLRAVGSVTFDNLRFFSNDRLLVDDEFDRSILGEWETLREAAVEDGELRLGDNQEVWRRVTASWHDVRLEVDATGRGAGGTAVVAVKADTLPIGFDPFFGNVEEHTALAVGLSYNDNDQIKRLMILPPLDSGLVHRFRSSHLAVGTGLTYHLRIEIDDGLIEATIKSASWWPSERKRPTSKPFGPVSLISLEESWAFAVGDSISLIAPERPDNTFALDHPISEMRLWQTESEAQIGICVPDQHQVFVGQAGIRRVGI